MVQANMQLKSHHLVTTGAAGFLLGVVTIVVLCEPLVWSWSGTRDHAVPGYSTAGDTDRVLKFLASGVDYEVRWLEATSPSEHDMETISLLADLHTVRILHSQSRNLQPLSRLRKLRRLHISTEGKDLDLGSLAGASSLAELEIESDPIASTTSHLPNLPSLSSVHLYQLEIKSKTQAFFARARAIERLSLVKTRMTTKDWSSIDQLVNLKTVRIIDGGDLDLTPLCRCLRLSTIYIHSCRLLNVAALADLPNLSSLDAINCHELDSDGTPKLWRKSLSIRELRKRRTDLDMTFEDSGED